MLYFHFPQPTEILKFVYSTELPMSLDLFIYSRFLCKTSILLQGHQFMQLYIIVQLGPIPSTKTKVQFGPKQITKVTFNTTTTDQKLFRQFKANQKWKILCEHLYRPNKMKKGKQKLSISCINLSYFNIKCLMFHMSICLFVFCTVIQWFIFDSCRH